MHDWITVASLTNTKNLDGGLVAHSVAGLPFFLEPGDQLALVPPVLDAPRSVTVEEIRILDENSAVVLFDEVRDAQTAQMLVGCFCLMRRSDIPDELLLAADAGDQWTGWKVEDELAGDLGEIDHIEDRPSQALLVLSSGVMIPLVDEFIRDIDEEAQLISVRVPSGLLEL